MTKKKFLVTDNYSTSYQNHQQQLSLFPPKENPPPYPLQIKAIAYQDRVNPEWQCQVVHYESDLKLPGQFTYDEAKEILETTRYWDFTLDKDRTPRCHDRLLRLVEGICNRHSSKSQEVAA